MLVSMYVTKWEGWKLAVYRSCNPVSVLHTVNREIDRNRNSTSQDRTSSFLIFLWVLEILTPECQVWLIHFAFFVEKKLFGSMNIELKWFAKDNIHLCNFANMNRNIVLCHWPIRIKYFSTVMVYIDANLKCSCSWHKTRGPFIFH